MNQNHLKEVMSELGKRSWKARKARDPENKHLKKIAFKGGKARHKKRMGQAFRPDPF